MQPDASLLFSTATGTIGAGYHVTELKAADITSIDCGGNVSEWKEASLQLMDGQHGTHMKVGKFVGILEHSLKMIPALRAAPVHAEFSPGNEGLRRFEFASLKADLNTIEIRLSDAQAICKPAMSSTSGSCCGSTVVSEGACCS